MIWLAFRQFRAQLLVGAVLLAAVAITLGITGPQLAHLYATTVANCGSQSNCQNATQSFTARDHLLQTLSTVVVIVPGLIGIFWGAPLIAREFETGTYRLAWAQSVTRRRWVAIKLALVGFVSMVTAGLFSLMVTWWSRPFDKISAAPFGSFDHRDIVPVGYAAFAFAFGVTIGVLLRKTLPAMAITLVGFVGVRLVFTNWIRTRLISPVHLTAAFLAPTGRGNFGPGHGILKPGDWIVSDLTVDQAGTVIGRYGGIGASGNFGLSPNANGTTTLQGVGVCPNKFSLPLLRSTNGPSAQLQREIQRCVDGFHLREVLTYQPASRFWTFQWYELAIFMVAALVLAGFSFWWVDRRAS